MHFCALDAETEKTTGKLLGVAFYGAEVDAYLTDPEQSKSWISGLAAGGYTFCAHNAEYDLSAGLWQLEIPFTLIAYDRRFNRAEWRYSRRRPPAELWCTQQLSGGRSLAELGAILGYPKYPTPAVLTGEDISQYRWQCDLHGAWECVECYAIRDAEIAYRFMEWYSELGNRWQLPPKRSIPSFAVDLWHQLDRPGPIKLPKRKLTKLARSAYYGGRVETFKLGHLPTTYRADLTWAYVWAMMTTPYPDPAWMCRWSNLPWSDIPPNVEGVVDATVAVPASYCPPLPWHTQGERVFPVGRMRGAWTLRELRQAEKAGTRVERVHEVAWSSRSCSPFATFCSVLWEIREQMQLDGDPREKLLKLIGVSLYGRIGMDGSVQQTEMSLLSPENRWSPDRFHDLRWLGRSPYGLRSHQLWMKGSDRNVLWAATTTAAVRILLHRHLSEQGSALAYCDTDSLWSLAPILGTGAGLGGLRLEETATRALLAAPKLYNLEFADGSQSVKAKGVAKEVAREYLQEQQAEWQEPLRPLDAWSRRRSPGQWIAVKRSQELGLYRRHPVAPDVLLSGEGWSDTVPLVAGPDSGFLDALEPFRAIRDSR